MGRRKKKKEIDSELKEGELNISSTAERWLIGVLAWGIACIVVLSLFNEAGIVGKYLGKGMVEIFGWGKYLIPFILMVSGYWIIRQERLAHPYYRVNGLFLTFICALAISSLVSNGLEGKVNLPVMKSAGGYVGLALGYAASYLGFWGGLIILITLFFVGIILLLDGYFRKVESAEKEQISAKTEFAESEIIEKEGEEAKEFLAQGFVLEKDNWKNSLLHTLRKVKNKLIKNKRNGALQDLEAFGDKKNQTNEASFSGTPSESGKNKKGSQHLKVKIIPGLNENWKFPSLDILEKNTTKAVAEDIKTNSAAIKKTLLNFGIPAEVAEVNVGPTVTQYAIKPAEGIKLSRITAIQSNLAMSLAAHPIRIEAPIPGRSLVGVEVPNKVKRVVNLCELIEDPAFKESPEKLLISLGEDPAGNYVYADLSEMPHLLIAGATGSGKSIDINCLIASLLYRNTPREMKMIMVDPKRVELSIFNNIPHLLTPVIVDHHKVANALKWAVSEMERRYIVIQETMSRNIVSYNQKVVDGEIEPEVVKETGEIIEPEFMPYIVIIIDELADLMSSPYAKEVEALIVRLAQMSRAVGIHLVLSTQRPSVNVITGIIKANFPTRIAFQVVSQVDSRTILDMSGAEKLLGRGDMLYLPKESNQPRRIQGTYISEKEVQKIVDHLIEQEVASYNPTVIQSVGPEIEGKMSNQGEEDELYNQAREIVLRDNRASTSLLQRHLRIGYSRAARIMDLLEENGVIGPAEGSRPRQVIKGSGNEESKEINYENPAQDQEKRDNWTQ
ncbi:MAG: DNA translocase FtsK [Candidatus Moranbacteria bacterium]|nr:DNA translocase FtsK [Candidatus Moranbacteria bacterium]